MAAPRRYTEQELRDALAIAEERAASTKLNAAMYERVIAVLRLRILGHTAGQISKELGIKWENTVHVILHRAVRYKKCDCQKTAEERPDDPI